MKTVRVTTIAFALSAMFVAPAFAAIQITVARIVFGQVEVLGFNAPRQKTISWEGVTLAATSSRLGTFAFSTTSLPDDCIGLLIIGAESRNVVITNCNPVLRGVPKTGQTTSYSPGDDGEAQAGLTLPDPRFTDNLNGTITDNLTKLIWLQNANCAGSLRDWLTSLGDVISLNSTGTMDGNDCGDTSNGGIHQSDWRLPNVKELQTLVDFGETTPAVSSGHPFSSLQTAIGYWASTTSANSAAVAWFVQLVSGLTSAASKVNLGNVIAVRGGS